MEDGSDNSRDYEDNQTPPSDGRIVDVPTATVGTAPGQIAPLRIPRVAAIFARI